MRGTPPAPAIPRGQGVPSLTHRSLAVLATLGLALCGLLGNHPAFHRLIAHAGEGPDHHHFHPGHRHSGPATPHSHHAHDHDHGHGHGHDHGHQHPPSGPAGEDHAHPGLTQLLADGLLDVGTFLGSPVHDPIPLGTIAPTATAWIPTSGWEALRSGRGPPPSSPA